MKMTMFMAAMMTIAISATATESWPTSVDKFPTFPSEESKFPSWPVEIGKLPSWPTDTAKFPNWPESRNPSWPTI